MVQYRCTNKRSVGVFMRRFIHTKIIPLCCVVLGIWIGTYIVFQEIGLIDQGFYLFYPGENIIFLFKYRNPSLISIKFLIASGAGFFIGHIYRSIIKNRDFSKKIKKNSQGSSRWAESKDIKKGGFLKNSSSIVLGHLPSFQKTLKQDGTCSGSYKKGELVTYQGNSNTLLIGATRSGKGVGVIMPTLVTWKESIIVLDLKGELASHTLEYRSQFSRVLLFSPDTPENSARYNPLDSVRRDSNMYDDLTSLAFKLWPEQEESDKDFWNTVPRRLFTIIGYYLITQKPMEKQNLSEISRFLSQTHGYIRGEDFNNDYPLALIGLSMIERANYIDTKASSIIKSIANDIMSEVNARETWEGHKAHFDAVMAIYNSPAVEAVTCFSDFQILDFLQQEKPTTLYLVFSEETKTKLASLIRIIFNQFSSVIMRQYNPIIKNNLLILIDEFYQLGKMKEVEQGLAVLAGYGVRYMLVIQSLSMIEQLYGASNSIMDNCGIKIIMKVNNYDTAEKLSKALGEKTLHVENRSKQVEGHASFSDSTIGRRLLDANEIMRLDMNDVVILGSNYPIKAHKVIYFKDTRFKEIWGEIPQHKLHSITSLDIPCKNSFLEDNLEDLSLEEVEKDIPQE